MTRTSLTMLMAAAVLVTACGGKDAATAVASGKSYLDKGEVKAAIIEFKTALADEPDSAEARFYLGKSLLQSGDANGAALELSRALALRFDEERVAPELARALLQKGDFQRLLDQLGQVDLKDPLAQSDLKVTLARAYGALGRREPARTAIQAALTATPDFGPAVVVGARLQADQGDIDGAIATISSHLQRSPQDLEGWQTKGELLYAGKHDNAGALAAYRQALTLRPSHLPAQAGVMTIHLANGDKEQARQQLDQMRQALPKHPQTLFYTASVSLMERDLDAAKEAIDQVLRYLPDSARVLQLAGSVEFERKSFGLAEAHLVKALQIDPKLGSARRVLAATYLQRSEPAKALSTLQPMLDAKDPAAAVQTLAAQAHLMSGNLDEAEAAFSRATKLQPDDPRTRTAYAVTRILRHQDPKALGELRLITADQDSVVADLPLIATLMRQRDFKGALAAIDALEKKQPDKPMAANLRARLLVQQNKRAESRAEFKRALAIQPTFYPAAAGLVQMALQDGKIDDAIVIIDEFLKNSPTHSQAIVTSAALHARNGADRDQIIGIFTNAIRLSPIDPTPRLALINYRLGVQDLKGALTSAQEAVAAISDNPGLLDALGRAQLASGEKNQAILSFGKLAQMVPNSPDPHLRVADAHWASQDAESALQALRRALAVDPQNLRAQRAMVDIYLATNQEAEARKVTNQVIKQRPDLEVGYLMAGAIDAQRRRWAAAIQTYQDGLTAIPDATELASRLVVAYSANQQEAAAKSFAVEWQRKHPRDARFKFFLADVALSARDLQQAERMYREVLELQPENALAMNNVAWLMASSKQRGAVQMAERAVAALPDRAVILDTLAFALASEGQPGKAVEVMQQAVKLEEKNPQLRLNLAKFQIEVGDKAAARGELEDLAKLGEKFPRHGEVAELLKTLGS